ncbi:carbohydrate ABC transporter permease [Paenibacillus sp. 1P07SE]|uniref:carbohydrate ABC transporter permease n=1 Tax=Paenibacillus sp. 1P07SE TaxID=3132209 RepID=UPI0039A5A41C
MNRRKPIPLASLSIHVFLIAVSAVFIVPLWSLLAISISKEADIMAYGYRLLPKQIDFHAYAYIFSTPAVIWNAYKVTIIMSLAGSILSVLMISMCAYALSRKDFAYRRGVTFFLFFTMLFNGGLVPTYILMTNYLKLQNTYPALIIPLMGSVWFLLLMRTFFQQLPGALVESATIDGAGEFRIYWRIILPLSTPVMATIGLLQLLQYWNSWFQALLYISDKEMYPLQYLLQVILRNMDEIMRSMNQGLSLQAAEIASLPTESARMAMAVLSIGPMLMIFPFFQKYFVKGLTVGSIKE